MYEPQKLGYIEGGFQTFIDFVENRVEGLTTAAGLWMVAAIGMAVGLRLYVLGAVASLLVLLVFILDYKKMGSQSDLSRNDDE